MNTSRKPDIEEFDAVFSNIAKLYDHAENILKTAYHPSVENHEAFVDEIDGIVRQIEDSANTIAEDFEKILESGQEPSNAMKMRVSSALRKILISIDEFKERVKSATE